VAQRTGRACHVGVPPGDVEPGRHAACVEVAVASLGLVGGRGQRHRVDVVMVAAVLTEARRGEGEVDKSPHRRRWGPVERQGGGSGWVLWDAGGEV